MSRTLVRSRAMLAVALLVSVLWLGCTGDTDVTAPAIPAPNISQVDAGVLAAAITAQERHTDGLMVTRGVVGTAVGLGHDGEPVIKVYVVSAGLTTVPDRLDGIPVAVEVTGEIFALQRGQGGPPCPPKCGGGGGGSDDDTGGAVDPTAWFDRAVPIGVSTGHPSITAGTIGARVTDGTNVFALSNNHVYAASNSASIGDAVIQPGTFDGGSSPADDIGTLADFEPIVFSTLASNVIDAAIALSSTADLGNATPSDGYGTPRSTTIAASVNMKVMKFGRTTSQTAGKVDAINATVNVNYGSAGVARFVNQIIILPGAFSAGGDSGSLIVVQGKGKNKSDDRKPVGLLFAGSAFFTVANPIDAVLGAFGVTLDGN